MYRFEARIVGRSQGKSATKAASHNTGKRTSAVASAAYLSRSAMTDERSGTTWDYSRHFGGAGAQLLLPANAPAWMHDRSKLWNQIEWVENRVNSMLARDYIITMPYGLTREQQWAAIKEFAHKQFVSKGKPADIGLHVYGEPWNAWAKATTAKVEEWKQQGYRFYELDKLPENDTGPHVAIIRGKRGQIKQYALYQPHMHLMTTFRTVDPDSKTGFSRQKDTVTKGVHWAVQDKAHLRELRKAWADTLNKHLAFAGRHERVDHRSLAAQGIDREPEPKKGPVASKMEREDRGDESHAVLDWRNTRARNTERKDIDQRAAALEAEIYDILVERLHRMKQGVTDVEIPEQQWNMRDDRILADLGTMEERRQRVAAWDEWSEEEQKRLARTATSRNEDMETRSNRGDIADANDRWAKAMHDSFNALGRPEANMVAAVGLEAERFRYEQKDMRAAEAKEPDPAKKKMLEFDRQISACDYMQVGAERCAAITSFIVGNRDNAISNRDREHASEWREIGDKLRADRAELKATLDKGIYEQVDAFLKDTTRGWQPMPSQNSRKEDELKEQFFGWDPSRPKDEFGHMMGRDLPPGEQPRAHEHQPAWQAQTEPAWRNLEPGEKLGPNQNFTINEKSGAVQVPEKDKESPQREGEAQEEITEAKAAQLNKEDTTFDQDAYDNYWRQSANETGRGSGRSTGGMSR